MTTHWLTEQITKGNEGGTVGTLVDTNGTVWSVGDELTFYIDDYKNLARTKIATIYPGHGGSDGWDPNCRDVDSVWFLMENGWMVRPWLTTKTKSLSR